MAFSILVLDLHNTLYDETLEYGLALDEGVSVLLEAFPSLPRESIYAELAEVHRMLGSDWDDDAWAMLPSLKDAPPEIIARAIARRQGKSRELTTGSLYSGTREALAALKSKGIRIFVVTEAAADAGMQALEWLGLGGIVDGMYSYPSRKTPAPLKGTWHKPFPPGTDGHLRKPHPFLLAQVALNETTASGRIPSGIRLEDVFALQEEEALLVPELPREAPVQRDIAARLRIKDTPYADALKRTMSKMLYVGDSKFRDGMLARNAGVAFALAAYGKKGQEREHVKHSIDIMYAVTGWDKDVMKLTQEAGRSQAVAALTPDFILEDGLGEALGLFG